MHRTRQGFVEERTATYNRLRGLLAEFGAVLPQKPERLRKEIGIHLEALPGWANQCIRDLLDHAGRLEEKLDEYDRAISEIAREDERSKRLMQLRGIGPTTASALAASIGAGHDFRNGRQVAAWLGLTPGQHSSGGKQRWAASPEREIPIFARCWYWGGQYWATPHAPFPPGRPERPR